MHSLSELISKENGAILVVDYGEDHAFSDSVRGIRRHKYLAKEDLLESAGEADLSVYVNF
jgi:NADH dehydrogenase [ubiquinone] 1 alpha subcomplex assembly factor 7